MKTLMLRRTGYVIKGISDLTPWGGGNACIAMRAFKTKTMQAKEIMQGINDNGFGVEKINGAICDIYEDFEGTLRFIKNIIVGKVSDYTQEYYNNQN
jgi:hypothetical protein